MTGSGFDPGENAIHRELREAIGAYVLGHLPADEAARVEAHLSTCPACRAEHDELAPVAAALRDADISHPTATGHAPRVLGRRIEHRIRAERRRRGVVAVLAAAAAAAVLVVGLRLTEPDPAPTVALEPVAVQASAPQVSASANLVAHTWGVEVKLLARGLGDGQRYDVAVVGADGTIYPAGAFLGTAGPPVACNLNAGVMREDAAQFVVTDMAGSVVLSSRFPA